MTIENGNFTPSKSVPSSPIEERLENVLLIMKQLSSLIEVENEAIQKRDFETIKSLQENKRKLTLSYAEGFKGISVYKDFLKSMDAGRKKTVEKITKKLDGLMEKNALLLKSGIYASKKVIEIIVKSAEEAEQETKGYYSKKGTLGDSTRYRSALSVNEEF